MRILAVMASGARGGGAEHLLGLLPALRERGLDVQAWVGRDGPLLDELRGVDIESAAIELMHARMDPLAAVRLRRRVARARVEEQVQLVHWHGTRAAFYGAVVPGPSVYTAHGLAFRKETTPHRRAVFLAAEAAACRATRVISVSRTDRDELVRRRFVRDEHAVHIGNAVRPERFSSLPDREDARRALGLPVQGTLIGTTSRLVEQKGVDVTLRAMAPWPEARLVVAGDGP
ncbi:MAG: glycosyltransferase, partial [Myxococcota bacterium]